MTEEFAIQQQNQGSNLVPGALIGGAIGAAGGAGLASWGNKGITRPVDLDKVFEQEPDTFKRMVENESGEAKTAWETARDAVKSVKDAEEEFDKKVKEIKETYSSAEAQLPDDNAAKKKLNALNEQYENAIERKMNSKKTVTRTGAGEIVPYDPNWSMTANQVNEYKKLQAAYESAKRGLAANSTYDAAKQAVSDRRTALETMYEDILNNFNNVKQPASKKKSAIKTLEDYLTDKKAGPKFIEDYLEKNPELINITDAEYANVAEKVLDTKPAIVGSNEFVQEITVKGKTKYAVIKKSKVFGSTEYQKLVESKQNQAVDNIIKDLRAYSEAQEKLANLHETIKFDKSLLRKAGITRPAGQWNENGSKISDVKAYLEDLESKLAEMQGDMKTIRDAGLHNFDGSSSLKINNTAVEDLLAKYNVSTPKELHELLGARVGIAKQFATERKAAQGVIDGIIGNDEVLKKLLQAQENVERAYTVAVDGRNVTIRQLESRIRSQFGDYLKPTTVTTTAAETFTREEAIKALEGSQLLKDIEAAKKAVDAEIKKLGLEGKELTAEELEKILQIDAWIIVY